ncbi:MAG TPA: hypothetical protein VH640_19110 [Bryobacteraceae bacterium]|jgi:hypothetical protein
MKRVLFITILVACLVYAGDYLSLRLQVPNRRPQFGSVLVERYYAVPLKNRRTEFMPAQPAPVTCVHSLFPHFGDPPCWYLSRHTRQEIKLGALRSAASLTVA